MISARRTTEKFRANPTSLRYATTATVSVTVTLVVLGAAVMRIFDHAEYPTYGAALWFTLQTVTTVGYGDMTPVSTVGRGVASVVMVFSIGVITMTTAIITSLFINAGKASRSRSDGDGTSEALARIEKALAAANERLDQIENASATPSRAGDDTA